MHSTRVSYFLLVTALALSTVNCGVPQATSSLANPIGTLSGGGNSGGAPGGSGGSGGGGSNGSGNSSHATFANLQQQSGWNSYALLPSVYAICQSCSPSGPEATWSMKQQLASPSLSGNSTRFDIGGQTQFADILWNNHLIGDFSSQALPDHNRTLVPSLHNFVYDVYFFGSDIPASQALEFDINQFEGGKSFIWGHECRIAGGHEWDIWDNQGQKWIPTGIACNPLNNAWNHVVLQVQRTTDDHLLFLTITLNGETATLNHSESPTPTTWFGITVNYQQDGNSQQQPYSIWLDKFNFSYW